MSEFKLKKGPKVYHIQAFVSLLELARRGHVRPEDPVFVPGINRWVLAGGIRELRPMLKARDGQPLDDEGEALELSAEFVEALDDSTTPGLRAGLEDGPTFEIDAQELSIDVSAFSAVPWSPESVQSVPTASPAGMAGAVVAPSTGAPRAPVMPENPFESPTAAPARPPADLFDTPVIRGAPPAGAPAVLPSLMASAGTALKPVQNPVPNPVLNPILNPVLKLAVNPAGATIGAALAIPPSIENWLSEPPTDPGLNRRGETARNGVGRSEGDGADSVRTEPGRPLGGGMRPSTSGPAPFAAKNPGSAGGAPTAAPTGPVDADALAAIFGGSGKEPRTLDGYSAAPPPAVVGPAGSASSRPAPHPAPGLPVFGVSAPPVAGEALALFPPTPVVDPLFGPARSGPSAAERSFERTLERTFERTLERAPERAFDRSNDLFSAAPNVPPAPLVGPERLFEPKPFEPKPFEPKPFEPKPFEPKPFEPKPFEPKLFDGAPGPAERRWEDGESPSFSRRAEATRPREAVRTSGTVPGLVNGPQAGSLAGSVPVSGPGGAGAGLGGLNGSASGTFAPVSGRTTGMGGTNPGYSPSTGTSLGGGLSSGLSGGSNPGVTPGNSSINHAPPGFQDWMESRLEGGNKDVSRRLVEAGVLEVRPGQNDDLSKSVRWVRLTVMVASILLLAILGMAVLRSLSRPMGVPGEVAVSQDPRPGGLDTVVPASGDDPATTQGGPRKPPRPYASPVNETEDQATEGRLRAQIRPQLQPLHNFDQAQDVLFGELLNLKVPVVDVKLEPLDGDRSKSVRTAEADMVVRLKVGRSPIDEQTALSALVCGKYLQEVRMNIRFLVVQLEQPGQEPLIRQVPGAKALAFFEQQLSYRAFLVEVVAGTQLPTERPPSP